MTRKKLLIFTLIQWAVFTLLKIIFFNYLFLSNYGAQEILFWLLVMAFYAALVRRFGVITFLEAFFVMAFWTLLDLFLDLIVTSAFTGLRIFSLIEFWAGFFFMNLSIFLTHKKFHIHRRHELHAKEHGGHGHGNHHTDSKHSGNHGHKKH